MDTGAAQAAWLPIWDAPAGPPGPKSHSQPPLTAFSLARWPSSAAAFIVSSATCREMALQAVQYVLCRVGRTK